MQRYFAEIKQNKIILDDGDIHHLLNVMRAKIGMKIEAVADSILYLCEVSSINPLEISILNKIENDVELPAKITLFFALAKGDKIDFVVQKATELGVSKIVLFDCKRCVVNFDSKDVNKKLERYRKIAKEASEQCHRIIIPEIIGVYKLENIPENEFCSLNYVAYEKMSNSSSYIDEMKVKNSDSISIFIGPEGGFEENEIAYLNNKGVASISLGKRILRTETAAVNLLSTLGYVLEK